MDTLCVLIKCFELFTGPLRWGDHNEEWAICKTGKNQSPINILPQALLYDPQLQPLKIQTTSVRSQFQIPPIQQ